MKRLPVSIALPWLAAMLIAAALLTAPSPGRCEAVGEWVRIPGVTDSRSNCVGVSGDGTRFLMFSLVNRVSLSAAELDMYIVDAGTGTRTALYLSDSVDADDLAARLLAGWKMDAAKGAELMGRYDGAAAFAIRWMWPGWCAQVQTSGDDILVRCGSLGLVLIRMRSGETVPLFTNTAAIGPDGLVAVCRLGEPCSLYNPETGMDTPYALAGAEGFTPLCLYPLPGGGTAGILRGDKPAAMNLYEYSFAYLDGEGALSWIIPAGPIACGREWLRLMYSPQAGAGVTYNGNYAVKIPPLIFREGAAEACVLWLEGPDDLRAREIPCSQLFDAKGAPAMERACKLVPISLSGDGKSLMLFDYGAYNLLLLDLQTLTVRKLLTVDQAVELFAQRGLSKVMAKSSLITLCWNGGDFLTGWLETPGYALKLRME